jgi:hypothetical protein
VEQDELEQKAISDFQAHRGHIILANEFFAYNEQDDSVDVLLDTSLRFRVDKDTRSEDILRWVDEYLDPYWYVTPLDANRAELRGLRSFCVFGPGYNLNTGECSQPRWVRENASIWQKLKDTIRS